MNNGSTTFKSRWGFHPCEYDLFLKLKRLHAWYWQTLYDFHRWHRWWRKEAQNRIGPEPAYCAAFAENKTLYKPVRSHGVDGFKVYPKTIVDHGMVDLYQLARMPQPEPVQPFDAATNARIESLYQQVETHFNE